MEYFPTLTLPSLYVANKNTEQIFTVQNQQIENLQTQLDTANTRIDMLHARVPSSSNVLNMITILNSTLLILLVFVILFKKFKKKN
ncbi:MAG TPA: hypothetical protein ENI66_02275 [Candidatus Yonathbacteria bacterium]|nr:hypothetical protein [Candidatus Yonathbacteria bacterium]